MEKVLSTAIPALIEFALVVVAIPIGLAIRDQLRWKPMRVKFFEAFRRYFETVATIIPLNDNFSTVLQDHPDQRFELAKALHERRMGILRSARAALIERFTLFGAAIDNDMATALSELVDHVDRFERRLTLLSSELSNQSSTPIWHDSQTTFWTDFLFGVLTDIAALGKPLGIKVPEGKNLSHAVFEDKNGNMYSFRDLPHITDSSVRMLRLVPPVTLEDESQA